VARAPVTPRLPRLDAVAADVVDRVLAHPPTLGATRLVCVDGPAGSGKTTLTEHLRRHFRDRLRATGQTPDRTPDRAPGRAPVRVLHMDNLYAGWGGLGTGMATLATSVVGPLRVGSAGRYRRWDWHRDGYAEERVVEPCEVLLVEGVGSAARAIDDAVTCLVWVSTPSDVRLERGLTRDGTDQLGHWLAFRADEDAMFARERTRERADVVVDGTTGSASWSPC
jgi:cytidylate kinase